ncbi:MAG: acetyl-CoA carboxylase biotin carboxylase subunit family protein [Chloroflexota bacterium]
MNFVYLSPHFPPKYYQFSARLRRLGANVLGIADEPYERLDPRLQVALTEYYRVSDMHSYDQLLRGLGYFTHRYGRLDRLDSQNEYWLETEAQLRTDFNIFGLKTADMPRIKRKSQMKAVYRQAGVRVARGGVMRSLAEARRLVEETGYPLVAKPDIGVGAARTYKIRSDQELEDFFAHQPPVDYIFEEFISGQISSFDGLTDRDGKIVFYTAHQFSTGIMDTVNEDALVSYYSYRQVPADLEDAGRRTVQAFDVRERFFHLEFFRRAQDGCIVALEVNMRPPGGLTTDMFNYANDIDIYQEWANLLVNGRFEAQVTRPYHCGYVGRKLNRAYAHSHEQILQTWSGRVVHHEAMSGVFAPVLGELGYLVRSPDEAEIHAMVQYIQALA